MKRRQAIQAFLSIIILLPGCKGSQPGRHSYTAEPDSVFIKKHITALNTAKDSISPYFSGGTFYDSPDGNFRICVFEGESCHSYCTPCYAAQLLARSGKRWRSSDCRLTIGKVLGIGIISTEKKNSKTEYYLIDGGWKRPHEIEIVEYCNLYHLRYQDGSIDFLPLINAEDDSVYQLPVYYYSSLCEPAEGYSELPRFDSDKQVIRSFLLSFEKSGGDCLPVRRSVYFENGIFREKEEE